MHRYKIIVSYFDYRGVVSEDIYSSFTHDCMIEKMKQLDSLLDEGKINGYIIKEYYEDIYRKAGVITSANYPKIRRKE